MRRTTPFTVLTCAALLAAVACDAGRQATDPPIEPAPETPVVTGTDGKRYELVQGQLPAPTASASTWIGREGGTVTLLGESKDGQQTKHEIIIPEGAVNQTTLFTLTLGSTEFLSVHLRAERQMPNGTLKEVGHLGFHKPVTLRLTYSWATNVSDPTRLLILYDRENGNAYERIGGRVLYGTDKYIVAELGHFSKYAAAID